MLNRKNFLVKEHVGFLKLSDTFDLFDLESGQPLGQAKEKNNILFTLLRLLVNKRFLPTRVEVTETNGMEPVLMIQRGFSFLTAKVALIDRHGRTLGYLKSKLFSWGGGFHVLSPNGEKFADVKGDWKGWNFSITHVDGTALGTITKKWAGLGKELFTSADNYAISLAPDRAADENTVALLLAASLAIDITYKEK